MAVLAAAATLVAACAGGSPGTEPTDIAAAAGPSSSPGAEATAVESADQSTSDAGGGDPREGDGDGLVAGGDAAATAGGTQDAAAGGVSEGSASGRVSGGDAAGAAGGTQDAAAGGVSEGSASAQAGPGGAASEGSASEGSASGPAGADGAVPEGTVSEGVSAGVYEGSASEAAAPGSEPEIDPFVTGPIAPLTGSITTDLSLAQRRPLAVKVGNGDPKDRPQAGLAVADIVYEVLVEAGFTRFMAVFHSEIPSRVGPVRSARSSDFDILADFATPYLATSGANSVVLREMRQAARDGTLIDVGAMRMGAPYSRDRSRPAPHNLYFYYEDLAGGDPDSLPGGLLDTPPVQLFEYGSSNPPALADAAGVTVAYTTLYGGEVSHVWDPFLGGWVRIQDGILHTTETDSGVAEIAPANVVVVFMPYGRSAADRRSPQALSYGLGNALVLTAGSVHEAFWQRSEDRIGFRFWDAAGNPLSLSSGSTWLLLGNISRRWPLAEATVLSSSDATRMLADARAAADAEANAASAS